MAPSHSRHNFLDPETILHHSENEYKSLWMKDDNDRVPSKYNIAWLGNWNDSLPMEDGILEHCQKALEHVGTKANFVISKKYDGA
eukprot:CAMPEP_0172465228 /NCGR_PEP_ID=MMETSP1065-20121228/52838_1 /TAXON_ID=265537 /ORGANISM="Amphiprora paludosa, Strain CCMP125" /LENGTH=84 /DNA_ID=CAMNT_0013221683 /DNA_START=36 /DNA_END=286 /DNA_ORIENTATION=+